VWGLVMKHKGLLRSTPAGHEVNYDAARWVAEQKNVADHAGFIDALEAIAMGLNTRKGS